MDEQASGRGVEPRSPAGHGISVYVVSDHDYARAALADFLEQAGGVSVVGTSATASDAFENIVRLRPPVAIIDESLGSDNAFTLCRQLARAASDVACVILSAGLNPQRGRAEAFAAGADAYLVKQLQDFPLLETVNRAATRHLAHRI